MGKFILGVIALVLLGLLAEANGRKKGIQSKYVFYAGVGFDLITIAVLLLMPARENSAPILFQNMQEWDWEEAYEKYGDDIEYDPCEESSLFVIGEGDKEEEDLSWDDEIEDDMDFDFDDRLDCEDDMDFDGYIAYEDD